MNVYYGDWYMEMIHRQAEEIMREDGIVVPRLSNVPFTSAEERAAEAHRRRLARSARTLDEIIDAAIARRAATRARRARAA